VAVAAVDVGGMRLHTQPAVPALAPGRRTSRTALAVVLVTAALIGCYLWWQPNGDAVANDVDNLGEAAAAGLAAVTAVVAGVRCRGRSRAGWGALAAGELCWLGGQLITTVVEWTGGDVAFPGVPDVGFLLFPLGCLACLVLVSGQRRLAAGRDALDGVIIVVALLVAGLATSIGQVLHSDQGSALGTAVAVAYPLSDVALAATSLILLGRAATRRAALALLTAGLALLTVSDTGWIYLSAVEDFAPWQWVSTFWIAGFLVLACAAAFSGGRARAAGPRRDARTGMRDVRAGWQLALPYASTGLTLSVLLVRDLLAGPPGTLTVVGLVVLVALVLTRQLLALLEVRRLSRQLEYQAFHDPLTGLANRALFLDRLEHAVHAADRELRPIAVLFLDLDGFKTINDTLGHPVGDRALIEIAARLRACLDPADTVARLGGDEFAILLEGPAMDPLEVAAAVQAALRPAFPVQERSLRLRASIGIAHLDGTEAGVDATEMLRRADVAVYVAKAAGKDSIRTYRPDLATDVPLAADLAAAIEDGQVTVAYQPVVSPHTGAVLGVEALARWTHPARGPIPPSTFIPLAEQAGRLRDLTAVVLDTALATAARWRHHPHLADVPVSVNFCPNALHDPELVRWLCAAVARHDLPPAALVVEITETAPVDLAHAAPAVAALRAAGFGVAIDDFGAGNTSMAYLHQLPASIVKIDRALVATPGALRAGGLLATIVSVCHSLGRLTVAEGAETGEQATALRELGSDAIQGYFYSRPLPEDALLQRLTDDRPELPHPALPTPRAALIDD
jgi:diguanylate cyclase